MFFKEGMLFYTTSMCSNDCRFCSAKKTMKQLPNYHLSLDDIYKFIDYSQKANYTFDHLLYCGGEPMLWKHIEKATKLLKESNVVNEIWILSNALNWNYKKIFSFIFDIDVVKCSDYGKNIKQINEIEKWLKQINYKGKIKTAFCHFHEKPLQHRVKNSLPAMCNCKEYALINGRICICSNGYPTIHWLGKTLDHYKKHSIPLQENFMDFTFKVDRYKQEVCQYCLANGKTRNYREKVVNWKDNIWYGENGNIDYNI